MKPDLDPARGVLLIAAANLLDPNFTRSVILLCEHQQEGSFGLILNRELPIGVKDVVQDDLPWDAPLFRGGPVQENTMHFIHRCPELAADSQEVLPGIWWGGDFEKVSRLLTYEEIEPADVRFFIGYSGWGEAQLADEMDRDSWYLRKGREDLVFPGDIDNLWRQALRSMGPDFTILSNFPDDPRLN